MTITPIRTKMSDLKLDYLVLLGAEELNNFEKDLTVKNLKFHANLIATEAGKKSFFFKELFFFLLSVDSNNFDTDLFDPSMWPWQVPTLQVREQMGVMVIKGYSILSRSFELDFHHQIEFSITARESSQCILSSTDKTFLLLRYLHVSFFNS